MNARDPNLPLQADEATALAAYAERSWDEQIVPAMTDYIAIRPRARCSMPTALARLPGAGGATPHLDRGAQAAGLKLEVLRQEGARR